jgi:hypothetical protein
LRPEIFARVTERLVFHRPSYEYQLEIAGKFVARAIEFLVGCGHKPELDPAASRFLVRKGLQPKLGARPICPGHKFGREILIAKFPLAQRALSRWRSKGKRGTRP